MWKMKFREWDCRVRPHRYLNGRLCLRLVEEFTEDPIATATVNMDHIDVAENQILVKDWSENEGMFDALVREGIVKAEHTRIECGFVEAIKADLTEAAIDVFWQFLHQD